MSYILTGGVNMDEKDFKNVINYYLDEKDRREKVKEKEEQAKKDKDAGGSMLIYMVGGIIGLGLLYFFYNAVSGWF